MCGLAGYNIRPEIAAELTEKQQRRLLSAGIRHNLHRGIDATGYMASYPDENGIWACKAPIAGDKFLASPKSYLPKPGASVLAIHTRAASKDFDPSDNANNHPVRALGLSVTHNGIIRSHSSYRFKLDKETRDALPAVDSAVINAHFAGIVDPLGEMDDIVAQIQSLKEFTNSGYAFVLMWDDYPGVTVVVRGPEYPLHYIVDNKNGMHLYASQEKAARSMQVRMPKGSFVEPLEANFLSGSAMIVVDGKAEWFGNFEPKIISTHNTSNNSGPKYRRLRFDKTGRQVFETNSSYHWSGKSQVTSILEAQVAEDKGEGHLIPVIEKGLFNDEGYDEWLAILDKNNQKNGATTLLNKLFEFSTDAQHVYVWVPSPFKYNDQMVFMMYGENIEMVFDYSMTLCDTYDWSEIDPEFEWYLYPWILKDTYEAMNPKNEVKAVEEIEQSEKTFEEWFEASTTKKEIDCSKYAPEDASCPPKAGTVSQLPMMTGGTTTSIPNTAAGGQGKDTTGFKTVLGLDQFRGLNMKWFEECWYDADVVVTKQMNCKEHNLGYCEHEDPRDCAETMLQAYTILATCDRSVRRYVSLYGPQDSLHTFGNSNHEHDFRPVRYMPFQLKHGNATYMYKVCIKEVCIVDGCVEAYSLSRVPLLEKFYVDKFSWVNVMMETV